MVRYTETTVVVGGILEQTVKMYTENNHSTLYNDIDECIFDGYFCEAVQRKNQEVARMIALAESMGLTAEVR